MNVTRDQVREYIVNKLVELSQDWDSPAEISETSLIFSELGFESLDAVVLGVAIQEHFARQLPFAELLAELGERRRDLSVRELIDFVHRNLNQAVAEPQRA
jgi:acyl carrier protein